MVKIGLNQDFFVLPSESNNTLSPLSNQGQKIKKNKIWDQN
jgi:hypothetical protein